MEGRELTDPHLPRPSGYNTPWTPNRKELVDMMWGGPMGGYGSYGYGMGFLGIALMAVFWIAIIVGVVLLVRWLMAGGTHMGGMHMGMPPMAPPPGTSAALDILKERYAKGEITKEQFDQMKKDLGG